MKIKKSTEELVEETFEEFYDTVDRYGRGLGINSDVDTGRYIYQTLLGSLASYRLQYSVCINIRSEFSKYLTEKYKVEFHEDISKDIYYITFRRILSNSTTSNEIEFLIDKKLSEFLPGYLNKNPSYIDSYLLQVRDLCREYRCKKICNKHVKGKEEFYNIIKFNNKNSSIATNKLIGLPCNSREVRHFYNEVVSLEAPLGNLVEVVLKGSFNYSVYKLFLTIERMNKPF